MQSTVLGCRSIRLASKRCSNGLPSLGCVATKVWSRNSLPSIVTNVAKPDRYSRRQISVQTFASSSISSTVKDTENQALYMEMSPSELQSLAMKSARMDDPAIAHEALESLADMKTTEDLSSVCTTVMDAWIKYQNQCLGQLQESMDRKAKLRLLQDSHHAAKSASHILEKILVNPSSHHSVAVLKAWANIVETSNKVGMSKESLVRGIPQRMQHLLIQIYGKEEDRSTEAYNQILKAWAYSAEHLRGTMAEQIFEKMANPNGDSFRWIIRAWCWSSERRCTFTATQHYMRMMKLLENGDRDMEPTMEDYHILFRSWTKAE